MRYCFLPIGLLSNAGYVRARELGRALLDRGVQVGYVVDDLKENRSADLDPRAEVRFVAHPRSLRQLIERRRALRELRPDFVEVLNPHPKTLLALARLRGPRVVGVWDEPPVVKQLGLLRNLSEALWDLWLRRRADFKVVCARELQRMFRENHGQQTLYAPHAFYLRRYDDAPSPFDRPTMVYMGNFYPLWDQDLLFDAFELLARDGIKPPIVLMGTGPDVPKWEAFVREQQLDNVTFAGFMTGDALYQRLRHAHVLLFPIRPTAVNKTRCPSKTFAYAQARRPVISNRVGEVAEVLGEKGIYVEPTPRGFADAIRDAVASPRAPDIDYGIERHNYVDRVDRLLEFLKR